MLKKHKASNFWKFAWLGLAAALGILMIISFSPVRHMTEVVLK